MHLTWPQDFECGLQERYQRVEGLRRLLTDPENDDRHGSPCEVLLMGQVPIACDQGIERSIDCIEKPIVRDIVEPQLLCSGRLVTRQCLEHPPWHTRIEQNTRHDSSYTAAAGAARVRVANSITAAACSLETLG